MGRWLRVSQPVVAYHAVFVGVGDRTTFKLLDVGKGFFDCWCHNLVEGGLNAHEGQIQ